VSVRYSIEIVDGWRLDRQLTGEEYDLIDAAGGGVWFDPMITGVPVFFGNTVRLAGYDPETFILDAVDLMPKGDVADPPFAPEEWTRGKWIMGFYS